MIDPRFYEVLSTPTISDVASWVGAEVLGGSSDLRLSGFAAADEAGEGHVTFLQGDARAGVASVGASACLVRQEMEPALASDRLALLPCADPKVAFAKVSGRMARKRVLRSAHDGGSSDNQIYMDVSIEPGAVVGEGVQIGAGSRIGANAVVGPGVQIGRDCRIGAGAVVMCSLLGDGVEVFAGAVLGEAGFGLRSDGGGLIEHFGRVVVQDGVSIGASTCVDRGMLGDTVIGAGSHIDNQCHIGHNVRIGMNVAMAAYAGISGSTEIGDGALFGGRVGVADHLRIGRGVRVAGGSVVLEDIPDGETWGGYPAKVTKRWMRELAWVRRAAQKRL